MNAVFTDDKLTTVTQPEKRYVGVGEGRFTVCVLTVPADGSSVPTLPPGQGYHVLAEGQLTLLALFWSFQQHLGGQMRHHDNRRSEGMTDQQRRPVAPLAC